MPIRIEPPPRVSAATASCGRHDINIVIRRYAINTCRHCHYSHTGFRRHEMPQNDDSRLPPRYASIDTQSRLPAELESRRRHMPRHCCQTR